MGVYLPSSLWNKLATVMATVMRSSRKLCVGNEGQASVCIQTSKCLRPPVSSPIPRAVPQSCWQRLWVTTDARGSRAGHRSGVSLWQESTVIAAGCLGRPFIGQGGDSGAGSSQPEG